MNGTSLNGSNGNTRSPDGHELDHGDHHHNVRVFDDPNAISHVKFRIVETGKAKWQRFLHGGKWQVRRCQSSHIAQIEYGIDEGASS